MPTATIYTKGVRWGNSGYTSSSEYLKVGKSGSGTYYGRVEFPAINKAWHIKKITLRMKRVDEYSSKTLKGGSNGSGSWDSKGQNDFTKTFSVSSGVSTKEWDLTAYKDVIQGYNGDWYLHLRHGSGDNSYCEFQGGTSGSAPRLVIEYELASLEIPDNTITIGETNAITVGHEGTGLVHRLNYAVGETTGSIDGPDGPDIPAGWVINWVPPVSLAEEIPDSPSGLITINVETYSSGSLISTIPFEFSLALPDTMVPVIDGVTISLENPTGDTIGEFVQGRSRVRAAVEASSVYGADVVLYQMTIDGIVFSSESSDILSAVLSAPGVKTITITVTDTRGRTTTLTLPNAITVYPYTPPVVALLQLERALNDPPDFPVNNSGQYIKFTVMCVFAPINGKNTKSGSIRFRPTGGEWSDAFSLDDAMNDWGSTYTFPLQGLLGNDDIGSGSYEVEVTLADRYNTVTQYGELSSRNILWDAHANGEVMAFGGEAVDPDAFHFRKPVRISDGMVFDDRAAIREALGIYSGRTVLTNRVGSPTQYVEIPFGKTLPAVPSLVVASIGVSGGMTSTYHTIDVQSPYTTTGFTIKYNNNITGNTVTVWVDWIAIL